MAGKEFNQEGLKLQISLDDNFYPDTGRQNHLEHGFNAVMGLFSQDKAVAIFKVLKKGIAVSASLEMC